MFKGYTPSQMVHFLNIGKETFRYWRKNLGDLKNKKKFTGPDVLTFRIIKVLIEVRSLRVKTLKMYNTNELFVWCNSTALEEISQTMLVLDASDYSIHFESQDYKIDTYNIYLDYLQLRPLVSENSNKLNYFGVNTDKV